MKAPSQNEMILQHLQSGRSITPLEAVKRYNCLRLSGRIHNLREEGHPIQTDIVKDPESKKRFARYSLKS